MTRIDGEEIDTTRSDVPGPGCREQECPKYYETGPAGRCGVCSCVLQFMAIAGKECPATKADADTESVEPDR